MRASSVSTRSRTSRRRVSRLLDPLVVGGVRAFVVGGVRVVEAVFERGVETLLALVPVVVTAELARSPGAAEAFVLPEIPMILRCRR